MPLFHQPSMDEEWSLYTWRGRIRLIKLLCRLRDDAINESGPHAHESYRRIASFARSIMTSIEEELLPLGHHLPTLDRDDSSPLGPQMLWRGAQLCGGFFKTVKRKVMGQGENDGEGEMSGFELEKQKWVYLTAVETLRDAEEQMAKIEAEMAKGDGGERGRRRHRHGEGEQVRPTGRTGSVDGSSYERVTIAPTVATGHTAPPPINTTGIPGVTRQDFAHPPPLGQHPPDRENGRPLSMRPTGQAPSAPCPDHLGVPIPGGPLFGNHQQPYVESQESLAPGRAYPAQGPPNGQFASSVAPEGHPHGTAAEYYDTSVDLGENEGRRGLSAAASRPSRQTGARSLVPGEYGRHYSPPEIHVEPPPVDSDRQSRRSTVRSQTRSHRSRTGETKAASVAMSASSDHLRPPSAAPTHRSHTSEGVKSRHDSFVEPANRSAAHSRAGSHSRGKAGSGVGAASTAASAHSRAPSGAASHHSSAPLHDGRSGAGSGSGDASTVASPSVHSRRASNVDSHHSRLSSKVDSHHSRHSEGSKSKKSFWGNLSGRKDAASAVREGIPAARSHTAAWSFGSVPHGKSPDIEAQGVDEAVSDDAGHASDAASGSHKSHQSHPLSIPRSESKTTHSRHSWASTSKPPPRSSRPTSAAHSRRGSYVSYGPKTYRYVRVPSTSSRVSEPHSAARAPSAAASSPEQGHTSQGERSYASTRSSPNDAETELKQEADQPGHSDHQSISASGAASNTRLSTTAASNASSKPPSTSTHHHSSSSHKPSSTAASSRRRPASHHPSISSRRTTRSRPVSTIHEEAEVDRNGKDEGEKEEVFSTIDMFGFQRRVPRRKKCHHSPSLAPSGGCESEAGTDSD